MKSTIKFKPNSVRFLATDWVQSVRMCVNSDMVNVNAFTFTEAGSATPVPAMQIWQSQQ